MKNGSLLEINLINVGFGDIVEHATNTILAFVFGKERARNNLPKL